VRAPTLRYWPRLPKTSEVKVETVKKTNYKPLQGESFFESFLMSVRLQDWPNNYVFDVWSSYDSKCYQITAQTVIEFHVMRTGTGPFNLSGNGIPLCNIYISSGEEHQYWSERIAAFAEQGYDTGDSPVCLEFDSHLFANRKRQMLSRDRYIGMLVVCRSVTVEEDFTYDGPMPFPCRIPIDE
jgi:hypothetical protein